MNKNSKSKDMYRNCKKLTPTRIVTATSNYDDICETKRRIVCDEYSQLDEKTFIPLQDFLYMMEVPDVNYSPNKFVDVANEFPTEFSAYISDNRRICPNRCS